MRPKPPRLPVRTAGMMTAYTKSLRHLNALTATAVNTTANILSTGLLSAVLLSTVISLRWTLGAICLVTGTLLLTAAAQPEPVPQLVPLDPAFYRPVNPAAAPMQKRPSQTCPAPQQEPAAPDRKKRS